MKAAIQQSGIIKKSHKLIPTSRDTAYKFQFRHRERVCVVYQPGKITLILVAKEESNH